MATRLEEINKLLDQFGSEVVERAARNLGAYRTIDGKRRRRVASGRLKSDLTFKIKSRYNNPIISFTTKSRETGQYADVIEYGRKPNSTPPPIAPILKWIEIKGIRPRNEKGGFVKNTESARLSMARAISKSIGRKGIKGIMYYNDAVRDTLDDYGKEFLLALQRDIEIQLQLNKR